MPILFLRDDITLIEMYKTYFEARGYNLIVIRGGQEELQRAIIEGSSLVTFKTSSSTRGNVKNSQVIIFTHQSYEENVDRPKITSATKSSDVFAELDNMFNHSSEQSLLC